MSSRYYTQLARSSIRKALDNLGSAEEYLVRARDESESGDPILALYKLSGIVRALHRVHDKILGIFSP